MNLRKLIDNNLNQLGAIAALSGSGLSLALSTFYELAPCTLCYWQRIFLYPLAFIYLAAIWRDDAKTYLYSLPLSVLGLGFSAYHYALQREWLELAEACVSGVSCTDIYIEYFGFFTIPFGAMLGFLAITVVGVMQYRADTSSKSIASDGVKSLQTVVLVTLAIMLVALMLLETKL